MITLRELPDLIFGYDYFVSYKRDDGRTYPTRLAARLAARGFRVFLDDPGYVAGDDLQQATRRRVGMSTNSW